LESPPWELIGFYKKKPGTVWPQPKQIAKIPGNIMTPGSVVNKNISK
jgi:hypothetical protein